MTLTSFMMHIGSWSLGKSEMRLINFLHLTRSVAVIEIKVAISKGLIQKAFEKCRDWMAKLSLSGTNMTSPADWHRICGATIKKSGASSPGRSAAVIG